MDWKLEPGNPMFGGVRLLRCVLCKRFCAKDASRLKSIGKRITIRFQVHMPSIALRSFFLALRPLDHHWSARPSHSHPSVSPFLPRCSNYMNCL